MPRLALAPRPAFAVTGALLLAACQGHGPRPAADGPGGPPEAAALGVFDPAGVGPGAPPQASPARPLEAIDYGPIGRTEGAGQIHVRFNQPVVPLDLKDNQDYTHLFSFDPPLPGKAFFKSPELLVFEPDEALRDCHEYTVRFTGGLDGLHGTRFDRPLTWTFETVRPTVTASHPDAGSEDLRRDSVVLIQLDRPTTLAEVKAHVVATARSLDDDAQTTVPTPVPIVVREATKKEIKDTFYYDLVDYRRQFYAVKAASLWPAGSAIEVAVTPGLRSEAGPLPLDTPWSMSFKTYRTQAIESLSCDPATPCGLEPIRLTLRNPITEQQAQKITLTPRPHGFAVNLWDSWSEEGGREINFEGMFIPGTTYTVNIPASVRDMFGQTIAGGAKRPALVAPRATIALSSGAGILVPGRADRPATIGVESRHVQRLRVRIGVFDEREVRLLDESKTSSMPFPAKTFTHDLPLSPTGKGDWSSVALDLDALTSHTFGPVLVEVSADELVPAALPYGKPAVLRGLYRLTDVGLVAITSLPRSQVQAVRLSTGAPLPGAKIFRHTRAGELDLLGTADAHGQLALPPSLVQVRGTGHDDKPQTVRLVVADPSDKDRTYLDIDGPYVGERWRSRQDIEADRLMNDLRPGEKLISRVVSERGAYRPGELVRVVGWSALDTPFSRSNLGRLPIASAVDFELVDPQNQVVAVHKTATTAEGKYWAELRVPAEARLGRYEVRATVMGTPVVTTVKVEDYRVPEFTVEASPRKPDLLSGESTEIDVRASYYFGGPVPIRRLSSASSCRTTTYRPPGLEPIWTVGERQKYYSSSHGHIRTVHATPEPDVPGHRVHTSSPDTPDEQKRYPARCTVSYEVQDASLQGIGAETGYNVHPAAFYLAVAAPQNHPRVGDPGVRIPARAVDFAGNRVAAAHVDLTVTRHWRAPKYREEAGKQVQDGMQDRTEQVKHCRLDLTATGDDKACELPSADEGRHEITLIARDAAGREAHTTATYWVWPKLRGWNWRELPKPERLEVNVNNPTVRPGDTVEVAVRGPWDGAAGTLVLARGGIRDAVPFTLKDQAASFSFPVDDTWTPHVALEASVIVPADHTGRPRIESASAQVEQAFEHRYLRVNVDAPPKIGPGQTIDVAVHVRDSEDAPQAARVALWAVDEAVLDLTAHEIPDLLPDFISKRPTELARFDDLRDILYPYTVVPEDPWFDLDAYGTRGYGSGSGYGRGSGAGFGGRGSTAPSVIPPARSRFETTPVFLADLAVDATGDAIVKAEMPENLTTFRITAVASARLADGDSPGRFGKNDTRTTVTSPLVVRAISPRQLRPGDTAELAAIVQNNTDVAGKLTVTATIVDTPGAQAHAIKLLSAGTAVADLPAGGQVRLPFSAEALVPGAPEFELQATFTPNTGAPLHDGMRIPLPVAAERTLTERVAAYGSVTDDQPVAIPIKIPHDALPGFGGVTIAATSSLLGDLEDAVQSLVEYPYGCVEQTSSRLLPLVALHDLRKTYPLGIDDPQRFMQAGIERLLAMQTKSGGFGYWPGADEVHPYASAYATWVLTLARKAGYPVPEEALKNALEDLERRVAGITLANVPVDWGYYDGSRLAIAVHVLAEADRDAQARAAELFVRRQSLPLYARAFLLMAIHRMNPLSPDVTTLAAELRGNVQELQATAHTAEASIYDLDEFFHSDGRTDAILLMALLRVDPEHPLIVKLARGLLERRVGGKWRNTQENAYALVALADYAKHHEAETPDFTARAWVAQRNVLDLKFKGREFITRSAKTDMLDIVGLGPNPGAPLPIVLQRTGQGRLYYRLGAEWAPAQTTLPARSQGLTVTRSLRTRDGAASGSVIAGDPLAMDITITADARVRYVAIDIPLPAGLEGVSRTLGKGRSAATLGGSKGWWATHEEQRADRVVIFADDLQPGPHTTTVDLRATSRGKFSLPPVHAEAMYMPEVYGRTEGSTLEVR